MVNLKVKVGKNKLRQVTCSIPLKRFNKTEGVSRLVTFGDMRPTEILQVAVFLQQENVQLTELNKILRNRIDELNTKITDSSFDEITELVDSQNEKTESESSSQYTN